jgi:hypothetical protein
MMRLDGMGRLGIGLAVAGLACAVAGRAQVGSGGAEYFEFGTVVGIEQRSVEVQAFDPATRRTVRHTFALTRETRADLAHVGDQVEVIYAPVGGDLELRRLLVFYAGLPMAGPPVSERAAEGGLHAASPVVASAAPAPIVRSAPVAVAPATKTALAKVPPAKLSRAEAKARAKAAAAPVYLASSGVAAGSKSGVAPVNLGKSTSARTASVVAVPLEAVPVAKPAKIVTLGSLTSEAPSAECNRSDADWPSRPLRIAVLDFRYPTDREEAHDAGLPGGGAGTAVADLVFQRLSQQPEFAVERGDRRRLDRTDIAGAARLGRQLGVDAVLAGTFQPVEDPAAAARAAAGEDPGPQEYQLRAGVVDTCTGQLLLKLSSATCADGSACAATGAVSNKEAAHPEAYAAALRAPIDTLLYPLEHNGGMVVRGASGVAGVVTEIGGDAVVVRLEAGAKVTPGEQLAVHASRLAKNPSTYTLNELQDQEIGRVSVRSVQGVVARGTFVGDVRPKVGDAAEVVEDR